VASIDFGIALNAALQEKEPSRRSNAFGLLLAEWFAKDPAAALAYLKTMPRGRIHGGLFMILRVGKERSRRGP